MIVQVEDDPSLALDALVLVVVVTPELESTTEVGATLDDIEPTVDGAVEFCEATVEVSFLLPPFFCSEPLLQTEFTKIICTMFTWARG